MTNPKFEYVWKFLRKNDCNNASGITNGMRCAFCKKLLINAHNGPCGCRFCLECVTEHLEGEDRLCPCNGDDGEQELILNDAINRNVVPDNGINREIAQLEVSCPREGCEFRDKLLNMKKHKHLCEKRPVKCPYHKIGCPQNILVTENIDSHLINSNEIHATLLMDYIDLMKTNIANLEDERDKQARKIEQLGQEIHALKDENKKERDKQIRQITELQKTCNPYKAKLEELDKKTDTETTAREREMKLLREQQKRCEDVALRLREVWINVERKSSGEFIWCIDEWAKRSQSDGNGLRTCTLFSEPFYLHEQGHRMCLSIGPGSKSDCDDNFSAGWHVARGPFDDGLCWPIKSKAVVCLINQQTGEVNSSYTIDYKRDPSDDKLQQPREERNAGFCCQEFFSLRTSLDPEICKNDRILIRCSVTLDSTLTPPS